MLEAAPDFLFTTKSLEHLKEEKQRQNLSKYTQYNAFSSNMNVNSPSLVGAKMCL